MAQHNDRTLQDAATEDALGPYPAEGLTPYHSRGQVVRTIRKLAVAFELAGVLVLGWTLTRVVASLLRVPALDEMLRAFNSSDSSDFGELTAVGFVTLLIQFLCLMIPAVLITAWIHRRGRGDLGLVRGTRSLRDSLLDGTAIFCIAGLPMKALLVTQHFIPLGATPSYWAIFEKPWNPGFWLFMAVGSFLVIPVFEEVFYRGYAQGRAVREFGPAGAVFVAALFTASHFQYLIPDLFNVWMLASLGVLALAMALVRHLTGSILPAIVIHALMNIPLAHPYDIAATIAMLVLAFAMRARIGALTRPIPELLRVLDWSACLLLVPLAAAFAWAMSTVPGPAVLALLALLLVSIAVQLRARRLDV